MDILKPKQVHSTGGVASLIAIWRLGPRRGQMNKEGKLLPIDTASRPIINAIGVFILLSIVFLTYLKVIHHATKITYNYRWYGWFAFNVSSPIVSHIEIDDALGTIGLVTCIAPTCSCCSAVIMMRLGWAKLSYDNLLGALLAGLVAITASCYTVDIWATAIIGFFASPIFFIFQYVVRYKLVLDGMYLQKIQNK